MTTLALLVLLISAHAPQHPTSFSIAGVVVDASTGAPVPRAEMSIFVKGDELKSIADDSGRFRLQVPEPGTYPLSAQAYGYVHENLDQHGGYSTGVAVAAGLDSEHIVFRLHPQAVIYGRVSDQHGDSIRHANVQLFSRSGSRRGISGQVQFQAQTDDLGEYRFAHLLPGKYLLAVQSQPWYAQSGFTRQDEPDQDAANFRTTLRRFNLKVDPLLDVVYPLTFYPGVSNERSATELDLATGSQVEANIQLQPVPSVHVFLANLPHNEDDTNGINISANQSVAGSPAVGLPLNMTPIAPGEYEVAGLPPGEITFTIGHGGIHRDQIRTFSANVADGSIVDTVAASGAAANVSGRVVLQSANLDIKLGQLELVSKDRPGLHEMIQKDGSFSFPSLQAGTYEPQILFPTGTQYVQQLSATGATAHGREFTVDGTRDVQLVITLAAGVGQLTGLAQLDGAPKSGVLILLEPQCAENLDDDMRMDQSDSDGTFNLRDILPGKYFLMAIDGGWDLDHADPAVLKQFHDQAQVIQVAPSDSKKVTINVQRPANSKAR